MEKYKNHRWQKERKHERCLKCDLIRYRISKRILMAIANGTNHYVYEQKWEYLPTNKDPTLERPNCK